MPGAGAVALAVGDLMALGASCAELQLSLSVSVSDSLMKGKGAMVEVYVLVTVGDGMVTMGNCFC